MIGLNNISVIRLNKYFRDWTEWIFTLIKLNWETCVWTECFFGLFEYVWRIKLNCITPKWLDWINIWLDWILPQTACHSRSYYCAFYSRVIRVTVIQQVTATSKKKIPGGISMAFYSSHQEISNHRWQRYKFNVPQSWNPVEIRSIIWVVIVFFQLQLKTVHQRIMTVWDWQTK